MKKAYFLFILALLPLVANADPVEIDGIVCQRDEIQMPNATTVTKTTPHLRYFFTYYKL